MGKKSRNAGSKKSKPSAGNLANTKSVSNNIGSSKQKIVTMEDCRVFEALGLDPIEHLVGASKLTNNKSIVGVQYCNSN
jgi:hypothetical protein